MSKQLSWILLGILMLGIAAMAGVAAHPPEEHAEPGPTRRLSIVAVPEPEAQPYEEGSPYQEMFLDLSTDAAHTIAPEQNYTFSYSMLSTCGPLYLPYPPSCYPDGYATGELANIGDDFEIAPTSVVAGNLHFSYKYSRGGVAVQQQSVIGEIYLTLQIGDDRYRADHIPLGPKGGDFNVPLSFHWYPSCDYDYENDTETCQDEHDHAPENQTDEVWGHDAKLFIDIQGPYWYSLLGPTTSERLEVSLDTAGGSYIDVPEIVPVGASAASFDSSMVSIGHDDLDGDGVLAEPEPIYAEQGEDGTIYYAPGPALPLFLAAALGIALLARRRLG